MNIEHARLDAGQIFFRFFFAFRFAIQKYHAPEESLIFLRISTCYFDNLVMSRTKKKDSTSRPRPTITKPTSKRSRRPSRRTLPPESSRSAEQKPPTASPKGGAEYPLVLPFPQIRRTTSSPPSGLSSANLRISMHGYRNYAKRRSLMPERAIMRLGSHVSNRTPGIRSPNIGLSGGRLAF